VVITHGQGIGVHLVGSDGEVQVTRGRFSLKVGQKVVASSLDKKGGVLGEELDKAQKAYLNDAKIQLYRSPGHVNDFLNCLETRKQPITNAVVGSRSINVAHVMNLAYRHHVNFQWNPIDHTFAKGSHHPAEWLTRTYREKWKI
jgi:hypothetical protein